MKRTVTILITLILYAFLLSVAEEPIARVILVLLTTAWLAYLIDDSEVH